MIRSNQYFTFFLFSITLLSCSRKQIPPAESNQYNLDANKNHILFVHYLLEMNNNVPRATLISYTIKEGKLKPQQNPDILTMDYLIFEQLNATEESLDQLINHNPLIKTIEFVDDKGQLNKEEVFLDTAEYSLRTQIISSARKFILYFQKNNGEKLILHAFEL